MRSAKTPFRSCQPNNCPHLPEAVTLLVAAATLHFHDPRDRQHCLPQIVLPKFKEAFESLGMRTTAMRELKAPPRGQHGAICPSFHALGYCYSNCRSHASHATLSTADQDLFKRYLSELAALSAQA